MRRVTYLESEFNCNSDLSAEIKRRILSASRHLHWFRNQFKSHLTKRKWIMTLCTECMFLRLTKEEVTALGLLARRLFWSMSETAQDKRQWKRWNFQLCKLHDLTELATYIKIIKIMWEWHAIRMVNDGTTKRIFGTSPEGKRGIGKPKQRWEYCGLGISLLGERGIWRAWHKLEKSGRNIWTKAGPRWDAKPITIKIITNYTLYKTVCLPYLGEKQQVRKCVRSVIILAPSPCFWLFIVKS